MYISTTLFQTLDYINNHYGQKDITSNMQESPCDQKRLDVRLGGGGWESPRFTLLPNNKVRFRGHTLTIRER